MASRIDALKAVFSVPGKPITNAELLSFKKEDPEGFDRLGDEALVYFEAHPEEFAPKDEATEVEATGS